MKVLDIVDEELKETYKESINILGNLEKIPTQKQWNKIAGEKFYMTSITLKACSGINSWILLCLRAKECVTKEK